MSTRTFIAFAVTSTLACSSPAPQNASPTPPPAPNDVSGEWHMKSLTCDGRTVTTNRTMELDLTKSDGIQRFGDGTCTAQMTISPLLDKGDHVEFTDVSNVTCDPSPTCTLVIVDQFGPYDTERASSTCPKDIGSTGTLILSRVDSSTLSMLSKTEHSQCIFLFTNGGSP